MRVQNIIKVLVLLLIPSLTTAFVCNERDLTKCQTQTSDLNKTLFALNQDYSTLSGKYADLDRRYASLVETTKTINKSLINALNERDYYQELYKHSTLDKLAVQDFQNLSSTVSQINVNIGRQIFNFNSTLNQFETEYRQSTKNIQNNFYLTIAVTIVITLVVEIAILSLTFGKLKVFENKFLEIVNKVDKLDLDIKTKIEQTEQVTIQNVHPPRKKGETHHRVP